MNNGGHYRPALADTQRVAGVFGGALVAVMCYALKANLEDDYLTQHLPGYADYRQRVS